MGKRGVPDGCWGSQARVDARLAGERRLVQERTDTFDTQLRQEEEEMIVNKRRELEERVQERMRAEEEKAMKVKRAELEARCANKFCSFLFVLLLLKERRKLKNGSKGGCDQERGNGARNAETRYVSERAFVGFPVDFSLQEEKFELLFAFLFFFAYRTRRQEVIKSLQGEDEEAELRSNGPS
jgi:hypothetical protein